MITVWSIVVVVSVVLNLVVSVLYLRERFRYIPGRPRWLRLDKSDIGKDLKHLANKLAQIEEWLSSIGSNIFTDEISSDMWRIGSKVKLEGLSYVALHSSDIEKVQMALRNLSQIQGREAIKRAIDVIEGVKSYPLYKSSKELIDLVRTVLRELQELLKLDEEGNLES
jgi:hypothetical protein